MKKSRIDPALFVCVVYATQRIFRMAEINCLLV
jgi:hypothetical protein